MKGHANYESTLKSNAQNRGVVGRANQKEPGMASQEVTGQKMPQRKPNKHMSGEELLSKAMRQFNKRSK